MKGKYIRMIRLRSALLMISTVLCAFLLLSSQQGFDQDRQDIIDEGVRIKIEDYVIRQETGCWERAVTEAVALVDSMVRAGALTSRVDPIDKPPRPGKPGKPVIKQLPDSLGHSKMLNDQ